MNRLFWDIETSPNVVLSWRCGYKISIDSQNIMKERAIICIGYKWEGKKSEVITWSAAQDDKKMLAEFMKIAVLADELVAHNGDRFDMPWFKTRCILHGLPPFPEHKTIDTLQWARRRFYFNSNRLNYIAQFLGLGAKLKTEFGLWKEVVLNNDRTALARMARYCKRDVDLLERVWRKLAMSSPIHTHAGVLAGAEAWTCPRDGSKHVQSRGISATRAGVVRHKMQCRKCSGWYSISRSTYEKYKHEREGPNVNAQTPEGPQAP